MKKISDMPEDAQVMLLAMFEISAGDSEALIPRIDIEQYFEDNYESLVQRIRDIKKRMENPTYREFIKRFENET